MNISESLVLRAAHPAEASTLATMSRLIVEHGLNWRWTSSKIRRSIRDQETMVLVASLDGVIQGFAIMKFLDDEAHLFLLAVQPKAQKSGIGKALLEWLEKSCHTAGMQQIRLEVRANNTTAIGFYEKKGYRIRNRIPRYYDGRETAVVMVRNLLEVRAGR